MNLPTREEAKELIDKLSRDRVIVKDVFTLEERDVLHCALKVLNAYSSGTLIEARTEGEIYSIIHSKFLGLTIYDEKKLAHALVGKV